MPYLNESDLMRLFNNSGTNIKFNEQSNRDVNTSAHTVKHHTMSKNVEAVRQNFDRNFRDTILSKSVFLKNYLSEYLFQDSSNFQNTLLNLLLQSNNTKENLEKPENKSKESLTTELKTSDRTSTTSDRTSTTSDRTSTTSDRTSITKSSLPLEWYYMNLNKLLYDHIVNNNSHPLLVTKSVSNITHTTEAYATGRAAVINSVIYNKSITEYNDTGNNSFYSSAVTYPLIAYLANATYFNTFPKLQSPTVYQYPLLDSDRPKSEILIEQYRNQINNFLHAVPATLVTQALFQKDFNSFSLTSSTSKNFSVNSNLHLEEDYIDSIKKNILDEIINMIKGRKLDSAEKQSLTNEIVKWFLTNSKCKDWLNSSEPGTIGNIDHVPCSEQANNSVIAKNLNKIIYQSPVKAQYLKPIVFENLTSRTKNISSRSTNTMQDISKTHAFNLSSFIPLILSNLSQHLNKLQDNTKFINKSVILPSCLKSKDYPSENRCDEIFEMLTRVFSSSCPCKRSNTVTDFTNKTPLNVTDCYKNTVSTLHSRDVTNNKFSPCSELTDTSLLSKFKSTESLSLERCSSVSDVSILSNFHSPCQTSVSPNHCKSLQSTDYSQIATPDILQLLAPISLQNASAISLKHLLHLASLMNPNMYNNTLSFKYNKFYLVNSNIKDASTLKPNRLPLFNKLFTTERSVVLLKKMVNKECSALSDQFLLNKVIDDNPLSLEEEDEYNNDDTHLRCKTRSFLHRIKNIFVKSEPPNRCRITRKQCSPVDSNDKVTTEDDNEICCNAEVEMCETRSTAYASTGSKYASCTKPITVKNLLTKPTCFKFTKQVHNDSTNDQAAVDEFTQGHFENSDEDCATTQLSTVKSGINKNFKTTERVNMFGNLTKETNTTESISTMKTMVSENFAELISSKQTIVPDNTTESISTMKTIVPDNFAESISTKKTIVPDKTSVSISTMRTIVPDNFAESISTTKAIVPDNTESISTKKTAVTDNTAVSINTTKAIVPDNTAVLINITKAIVPDNFAESINTKKTLVPDNTTLSINTTKAIVPDNTTVTINTTKAIVPDNFAESISTKTIVPDKTSVLISTMKTIVPDNFAESISTTKTIVTDRTSVSISTMKTIVPDNFAESISTMKTIVTDNNTESLSTTKAIIPDIAESISTKKNVVSDNFVESISSGVTSCKVYDITSKMEKDTYPCTTVANEENCRTTVENLSTCLSMDVKADETTTEKKSSKADQDPQDKGSTCDTSLNSLPSLIQELFYGNDTFIDVLKSMSDNSSKSSAEKLVNSLNNKAPIIVNRNLNYTVINNIASKDFFDRFLNASNDTLFKQFFNQLESTRISRSTILDITPNITGSNYSETKNFTNTLKGNSNDNKLISVSTIFNQPTTNSEKSLINILLPLTTPNNAMESMWSIPFGLQLNFGQNGVKDLCNISNVLTNDTNNKPVSVSVTTKSYDNIENFDMYRFKNFITKTSSKYQLKLMEKKYSFENILNALSNGESLMNDFMVSSTNKYDELLMKDFMVSTTNKYYSFSNFLNTVNYNSTVRGKTDKTVGAVVEQNKLLRQILLELNQIKTVNVSNPKALNISHYFRNGGKNLPILPSRLSKRSEVSSVADKNLFNTDSTKEKIRLINRRSKNHSRSNKHHNNRTDIGSIGCEDKSESLTITVVNRSCLKQETRSMMKNGVSTKQNCIIKIVESNKPKYHEKRVKSTLSGHKARYSRTTLSHDSMKRVSKVKHHKVKQTSIYDGHCSKNTVCSEIIPVMSVLCKHSKRNKMVKII